MGLKKIGKGPFRGATPKKVFQTIDVGSRHGKWIKSKAARFPKRLYAAVDPVYEFADFRNKVGELKAAGVFVASAGIEAFIEGMKSYGLKTRHFNIDVPPLSWGTNQFVFRVLREAPNVLLPNGKIFITSEDQKFLEKVKKRANFLGLNARVRTPLIGESARKTSITEKIGRELEQPVYRLEITFGLKKAISEKEQRKKWPSV